MKMHVYNTLKTVVWIHPRINWKTIIEHHNVWYCDTSWYTILSVSWHFAIKDGILIGNFFFYCFVFYVIFHDSDFGSRVYYLVFNMVGPKPTVPPNIVVDALFQFRESVVTEVNEIKNKYQLLFCVCFSYTAPKE